MLRLYNLISNLCGVSTAGLQLAHLKHNAEVYVTASSQEKIDFCKELGAKGGANYKEGSWLEGIKEASSGGVDLVLDCVGQGYFADNLEILNPDGQLVIIAWLSGGTLAAGVNLSVLSKKRISVHGSQLRARSNQYKTDLISSYQQFVAGHFESGKLKPIISKVFDWNDVAKAHEMMEANQNIGKIILTGM